MDGPANPTLVSRIHSRHRYQARQAPQQRLPAPDHPQPHDQFLPPGLGAAPRSRESMSRGHRFFHRRAVLDNVEIVTVLATVDEAGNVIAQETLPPVPPPSLPDVVATAVAAMASAAPVAQPVQLALPSAALAVPDVPALPIPAQPPVPVPAPALPSVAPAVPSSVAVPVLPAVPDTALPIPDTALPIPDTALPDKALPVPNPAIAAPVPDPALPAVPTLVTSSVVVPTLPTLSAPALAAVAVPAVPSVAVPAVPSVPVPVLPSVPAVPPFPTDLVVPTVPAYPFPSLNYVAQPVVTSTSSASTSSSIQSTAAPSLPSTINSAANTTLSSTSSLLSSSILASFDSISASSATDLAVSVNAVPTRSPSASQSLAASTRTSLTQAIISSQSARSVASASSAPTASSVPTTTANYGGWGGNAPGTAGAPAPTTSATSTADTNSSPSALETPKVIGSVLGSLAGVALILALILFLLKRHKQKRGGALQLTGDDHHQESNRSMTQAPAPSNTLVPIAFLKRFSGMSGKTAETSTSAGERSFQRVSGRKLPSAFSEGMTSDQFSRGGTMSGSSFYQDDHGLYGGTGLSKEMGKEIGESSAPRESGQMNFRPSPARTPIIRHPDDGNPFADRHHLSPPHSPVGELPPRGTLGRSLPSADGSRSSKFTENV